VSFFLCSSNLTTARTQSGPSSAEWGFGGAVEKPGIRWIEAWASDAECAWRMAGFDTNGTWEVVVVEEKGNNEDALVMGREGRRTAGDKDGVTRGKIVGEAPG